MRLTIRTKIILTVSLSLILIFAIIMLLLARQTISQLRANLNSQSKSFASLATTPIGNTFVLYQDSGSIRITQQVDKFLALDPDVTSIRIVSVDGKQLYNSGGSGSASISPDLAGSFSARYVTASQGYIRQIIQPYFEDSGTHRYSVVYNISTKRVEQSVNSVIRLILYVGIVILIISSAVTLWLLNSLFIKPLSDVSRSANLISSGKFDQQIARKQNDEIGDLAASVNKMAESLKADIVKLQEVDKLKSEFMMIASHNLRTPLTVMRGYIDMAEEAQTVQELKAIIQTVEESVVRLHLLSEDLLTISTLEAGGEKMQKTPVAVKKFIDSVASEFELLATKKKLRWQFTNTVPEDAKLNLSQSNMRSALGNIIDNAIKFTDEGGSVSVACDIVENRLAFTVVDTGIGIQADEMPKLFTKFHRGTSTATYNYEGVGIGLYLTKLIVEEHGGQVVADSQTGKGSTFTVYLPLAIGGETSPPPAPGDRLPAA